MLHVALAVGAGLVATAFCFATTERWLANRRRHELAWSGALAFFAIASFALAAGAGLGWNEASFKVFFLFGAIVNVPYLALGTVYLLAGERAGDRAAVVVTVLVTFAAGVVVASPLKGALPADELVQGKDIFGVLPRVFAASCSGVGALVVFGGAALSAWRYRQGRMLWANALIALGTAMLSGSGLLNSVLGEMDAFAVTLAAGVTVIFAGFLVASTRTGTSRPVLRAMPAALDEEASRPSRAAAHPRR